MNFCFTVKIIDIHLWETVVPVFEPDLSRLVPMIGVHRSFSQTPANSSGPQVGSPCSILHGLREGSQLRSINPAIPDFYQLEIYGKVKGNYQMLLLISLLKPCPSNTWLS